MLSRIKLSSGMNIPNALTVFRILLVPVFIIYVIHNNIWMALLIFILAGITDGLDGFLARILNQRTTIGAFLDPIADKFLLTSAYVALTVTHMLPGWLAVIVVSRDIIIVSGVVTLFVMNKKLTISPSITSKITTVMQIITVITTLLALKSYHFLLDGFIVITAVFTAVSGLAYIFNGIKAMGD